MRWEFHLRRVYSSLSVQASPYIEQGSNYQLLEQQSFLVSGAETIVLTAASLPNVIVVSTERWSH